MAYTRKTKDVHISPKLMDILQKISHKSEIAKKLLKTKISKEDLVDEPVDYLTVSKEDPSKISYAYPEKLDKIAPEDYWTFKGRVQAKPAAAMKKVLKDLEEKELDLFTSLYKAATAIKEFDFQVISGDDIQKYYNGRSYKNVGGSLYNSCMKYDHCNEFFQIYTDNPEVCQMLIMLDNDGYLMGRALLWNTVDVETGKEIKAMDRIYCANDEKNLHYFKEWADENGYIHRRNQKWADCMYFESYGKTIKHKLSIKLNKPESGKYPYVDTFKFLDEKNSIISNFLPQEKDNIRILTDNNGRTVGNNTLALDDINDTYENNDRLVRLDYPVNGVYLRTLGENLMYSEAMGRYMLKAHSTYDDDASDYIFNEEYTQYNDMDAINNRRNRYGRGTKKKTNYTNEWEVVEANPVGYQAYINAAHYAIFDANDMQPAAQPAVDPAAEPVEVGFAGNYLIDNIVRARGRGRAARINPYDNPAENQLG